MQGREATARIYRIKRTHRMIHRLGNRTARGYVYLMTIGLRELDVARDPSAILTTDGGCMHDAKSMCTINI